jgi:hypothetical protein
MLPMLLMQDFEQTVTNYLAFLQKVVVVVVVVVGLSEDIRSLLGINKLPVSATGWQHGSLILFAMFM